MWKLIYLKVSLCYSPINIANDPAVELNPNLSWEVNVLAAKLIEMAIKNKVKNSFTQVLVIRVKKRKVTEDLELLPISTPKKQKWSEGFMSYKDKIIVNCVRPATVCGLSERMRYDVSVNLLTLQALKKNKINVFGGNQTRPNIHINDLVRLYDFFLKKNIKSGFYNAGFENLKIMKIAKIIQLKTGAKIKISKSNDPRSYNRTIKNLENGIWEKILS